MNALEHKKGLQNRTKSFALRAIELFRMIPKTEQGKIAGKQFLRCATSVGANTRAAFRARSGKEFIAKAGIVIEEADESVFWLEMIDESGILKNKKVMDLMKESEELVSIFVSIVNKSR